MILFHGLLFVGLCVYRLYPFKSILISFWRLLIDW